MAGQGRKCWYFDFLVLLWSSTGSQSARSNVDSSSKVLKTVPKFPLILNVLQSVTQDLQPRFSKAVPSSHRAAASYAP